MTTKTEVRPAPAEPITPIRPSEAIRLGCLLYPVQGFGMAAFNDSERRACALQAMVAGGGIRQPWTDYTHCPIGDTPHACYSRSMDSIVVHLNDDHRWPRERIADWLAEQGL